jgi:hypothetical protein
MTSKKCKKEADVCWKFGLVNNMIQMIWKNRNKIINALKRTAENKAISKA